MDNYHIIFWNNKGIADYQTNFSRLNNNPNPDESQDFYLRINFIF